MPLTLLLSWIPKVSTGVLQAGWQRAWAWDTYINSVFIRPGARVARLLAFAMASSYGSRDHGQVGRGSMARQGLFAKLVMVGWW
jgi:hypothetical protein